MESNPGPGHRPENELNADLTAGKTAAALSQASPGQVAPSEAVPSEAVPGQAALGQAALARAASALNSGAIHLLRSLAAVDRQAGLTRARLSALSVLVFGGSRTLGDLAAAEGVAGPTMTRIVDGLIAEGLAERRPHPSDGRAVTIAATPTGDALMRAAQRRRIDTIVRALAALPADERSALVCASELLDHVATAVRAETA